MKSHERRSTVKTETYNAYTKSIILKHALKENNVSKTCALFEISRATFYHGKALLSSLAWPAWKQKNHRNLKCRIR